MNKILYLFVFCMFILLVSCSSEKKLEKIGYLGKTRAEIIKEKGKPVEDEKQLSKFDEAIYILIVDLISRKQQFGANNVNLDEITETVKDNIRASLNKLYLQQLISVDEKKNITLKQKK